MAARTAAAKPNVLERLREPFPASQVRKNPDGMHYVAIDGYINRLLDVLGTDYDFRIVSSSLELLPEDMKTRSGKRQYLAQVTGELSLRSPSIADDSRYTTRCGVGADVSFDPDKAVKTAQAEAFKKACHQFGIALELWNEDRRDEIDRQHRLASGSEQALKTEVWNLAKAKLGKDKPTLAEVAKAFGVEPGELSDPVTLQKILAEEGVL